MKSFSPILIDVNFLRHGHRSKLDGFVFAILGGLFIVGGIGAVSRFAVKLDPSMRVVSVGDALTTGVPLALGAVLLVVGIIGSFTWPTRRGR
jgi:hypothetical protein